MLKGFGIVLIQLKQKQTLTLPYWPWLEALTLVFSLCYPQLSSPKAKLIALYNLNNMNVSFQQQQEEDQ